MVEAFPHSEDDGTYIYWEWKRGLVKYKVIVLHYYPNLNAKIVDCHFSEVFNYAKMEREELLEIKPKDVSEVDKGDKSMDLVSIPTQVINKAPAQP